MTIARLTDQLSVSPQLQISDLASVSKQGFKTLICNRPDGEGADQPTHQELADAASSLGLTVQYLPVISGKVGDADAQAFGNLLATAESPVLAFCRSGMRSATLWALSAAHQQSAAELIRSAKEAGYDLSALAPRLANATSAPDIIGERTDARHTVVIVGGGAAGIATAASLRARDPKLDIAIIDPADTHYYQPGWTLVGAGIFSAEQTARVMAKLIPKGVHWIKAAVAAFEPDQNAVILEGCRVIRYEKLVVCPGLKLDWEAIPGLSETLGKNGVTSNYRYDLAPYTWQQVQQLRRGRALFTQPPMPIKCAGAPQKALYLSCDHWRRAGRQGEVQAEFYNAGAVLFGVADYVPALMEYIERYEVQLNFAHTLSAVDGPRRVATFNRTSADGSRETLQRSFDFLHAVPPQRAPDFLKVSPLADAAGWTDIDPGTLQHKKYANVFGLGDAGNTSNAKTAAAARKQAPVVAHNLLASLRGAAMSARYDGYGSCPLTVERGKIVLAEFVYGGKVQPSFPAWLIDGRKPSRLAWLLKERVLPPLYWRAMLKGREWMAKPELVG
ncbi:MAG: TIGR01244 family sulfur transferase [Nevskia sp.]|nr:TIGR01244 family sulfur transferase [Nevskia sp.]